MNNFKHSQDIYLIDGTLSGLLTLVHITYKNKILPKEIYSEEEYKDNLFDTPIYIETDTKKALEVLSLIKRKIGPLAEDTIFLAFLSNNKNKYKIIYDFIYHGFINGAKINYLRTIPVVTEIQKLSKNVKHEAHKFKGFVRFAKMKNEVLYSKIKPDNDVLELISQHFKYRLKHEYWCIIDERRNKGAFYNKKQIEIVENIDLKSLELNKNSDEDIYEELWKKFYKSVNIKERKNTRCQMNFMPKKYWSNILEVSNE